MLRKIFFWLKRSDFKHCNKFCPRCSFYYECSSEIKYLESKDK